MTIRWLPLAAETFVQIYDYYNKINPVYAKRLYYQIIAGINTISKFPMPAPREQLLEKKLKDFRALLIMRKFKIIYYIQNDTLYIFDI